jgi:hypothetical protein
LPENFLRPREATGNRVDFEVAEDVKVNGLVVIPKGAMAWGTIVDAKLKRRLGRAGKLDVRIDEVCLAVGTSSSPRFPAIQGQGTLRGIDWRHHRQWRSLFSCCTSIHPRQGRGHCQGRARNCLSPSEQNTYKSS